MTCGFTIKCHHTHTVNQDHFVDYTSDMIRSALLNEMHNGDIQREIFSLSDLDTLTNNLLISKIEAMETAREAIMNTDSNNAITQYKKQQRDKRNNNSQNNNTPLPNNNEGKCSVCNTSIQLFRKLRSGKQYKKAFTECISCWKQKQ